MKKILSVVLAVIMSIGIFAGSAYGVNAASDTSATEEATTKIFTDSLGREVEVPEHITKVAVSGPLAQIALFAICPDELVGIANEWDSVAQGFFDEKYYDLPVLGQLYGGKGELNLETLLASGAEVVIDVGEPKGSAKEDLDALQEQTGIPFIHVTATLSTFADAYRSLGDLLDKEEEAEKYFDEQLSIIEPIMKDNKNTGKTVAFFHVTANGLINVRKPGDYITRMIELSGGNYALKSLGDEDNALSTMNMQMEDFYAEASQADILIYNSTIGGEITSIDELLKKNELFKDFKAVKEGKVYCTERNLFQQTTGIAEFMKDLNDVVNEVDRDYTYINKLD